MVRFHSDAGSVIMFGDIAANVLKMMGQSGVVPGALKAHDVPAALERLKRAAGALPRAAADSPVAPGEDGQPRVSMRQRAFPLIELLERAIRKECDVIWEEQR